MDVLIIEDEPQVADFLKRGLEDHGFKVYLAMDGPTGLDMLKRNLHRYGLVILDIMLPGMSGQEVLMAARSEEIKIPIIMLTALGASEDIVSALNSGADDYLVKPFKFDELLARIHAVTRRTSQQEPHEGGAVYHFEDIRVDDDAKEVTRGGKVINLTATEYKLLLYLLKNPNKVLSRAQLLNSVWDINFDLGTNVVDVYINYLRNKIDKPPYRQVIQTVVGMGYILKTKETTVQ